jgi:hypothetical protein
MYDMTGIEKIGSLFAEVGILHFMGTIWSVKKLFKNHPIAQLTVYSYVWTFDEKEIQMFCATVVLGVGLYFVRITYLRFDEKHATPDLTNPWLGSTKTPASVLTVHAALRGGGTRYLYLETRARVFSLLFKPLTKSETQFRHPCWSSLDGG